MDIDFKKNFIVINYSPGTFGSFLSHCFYRFENVYHWNRGNDFFSQEGSAHLYHPEIFSNFHNFEEVEAWANLELEDRLKFLKNNLLIDYDENVFYIVRLTNPKERAKIEEVFDPNKIVEIKIGSESINLLSQIVLDKIINVFPVFKTIIKDYDNLDARKKLARESSHFFVGQSCVANGKNIIEFGSFFDKEEFIQELTKVAEKLNLNFDKSEILIMYDKFKEANEKYFSIFQKL